MKQYKFSDIAYNSTEKKIPVPGDEKRYIGLEHLDSGSLLVTRWGGDIELKGEKLVMKKGDVLFGRRNTYLRRAAIAPHDGIFSAHGMIFRPKTDVVDPGFFPFFISSDYFMDEAIRISVGSLSPTVNWGTLKNLEFKLPDILEQQKYARLLTAFERTKEAYKKLISSTDDLVKSQFIEMFGDPVDNPMGWKTSTIGSATEDILSGQCLNGDAKKLEPGQKAVLKVSAVTYGYFKDDEYKVLRDPSQITKGVYPKKGDLLFSRANTKEYVGATALVEQDYPDLMLPDKLWKLVFKPEVAPVFAKHFLSHPQIRAVLSALATGTSGSMYNISMEKLRNMTMIVPPIARQQDFILFVEQSDKSKFAAQQTLKELTNAQKALMKNIFG